MFIIAVEKGERVFFATHVAVGAAIDRTIGVKWLTVVAAFASHIVLDTICIYHPTPLPFAVWVGLWVSNTAIVAILLWKARQYWLGMVSAAILDIEWAAQWINGILHFELLPAWPFAMHKWLIPFTISSRYPGLSNNILGVILEAAILGLALYIVFRRQPVRAVGLP